jgi:hypothetical protein
MLRQVGEDLPVPLVAKTIQSLQDMQEKAISLLLSIVSNIYVSGNLASHDLSNCSFADLS